jgi:hypothetical protein
VAARQPTPRVVTHNRDRVAQAEPVEDPARHQVAVRQAGDRLEDDAGGAVADVRVPPVLAGREAELGAGERDDVVVGRRREVRALDQPRGVGEQVVEGDRGRAAGDREPGDVLADRGIEVQDAFVDQLQGDHRGERLADRGDRPQRVGPRAAVGAPDERLVAVRDRHRERRRGAQLQDPFGEVVEPLDRQHPADATPRRPVSRT